MSEPYTELFDYIRAKGLQSAFFVCGNAMRNLEVMCQTHPDGISIDENIPMTAGKEITDKYNITIGGNIPLTTTMLFGNQQDNMKYVVDMVDSVDPGTWSSLRAATCRTTFPSRTASPSQKPRETFRSSARC